MIVVELESLEVFGRHGVLDEERRDGQMFLYDVRLELGGAPPSDRVEDTVDYRDIAECVRGGLRRPAVQPDRGARRRGCRRACRALRGRAGARPGPQAEPGRRPGGLRRGYRRAAFALTIETARPYLSPATLRTADAGRRRRPTPRRRSTPPSAPGSSRGAARASCRDAPTGRGRRACELSRSRGRSSCAGPTPPGRRRRRRAGARSTPPVARESRSGTRRAGRRRNPGARSRLRSACRRR